MEFNINDPVPKKMTDRELIEIERKRHIKKTSKGKKKKSHQSLSREGSEKRKLDNSGSQEMTTEEEAEMDKKRIVLKKAEVEKVESVQKNIKFWFD
jgi:hypothetical protein